MKANTAKYFLLPLLMAASLVSGCMADQTGSIAYEHKVLALQDVEQAIFSKLIADGVAVPVKDEKQKFTIKDVEKAKSQNSMPNFLNSLGKEGWELTAINENQLYIFQRGAKASSHPQWEYKVLALNDINDLIVKHLKTFKAVEAVKDKPGEYKITDADKAKSQFIMPLVLDELGKEGWSLAGINKASLYIFVRLVPTAGVLGKLK